MTRFGGKWMAVAAMSALVLTTPASAQRDPAYQAARSSGQVGEKPDGYLGVVDAAASPATRALVAQINIRRRDAYTQSAAQTGSTVEQFAFTTGCNLINQTVAGEKYMAPDGRWLTRTAEAPIRDSRCV